MDPTSARWPIETAYRDAFGRDRNADAETVARLVRLMPADADAPARGLIPRTIIVRRGRPEPLYFSTPPGAPVRWQMFADQRIARGQSTRSRIRFPDDLPIGVYRLSVTVNSAARGRSEEATLLVTPERAYQGGSARRRMWALAVQLYGVRSHRNWGHGDFTDLAELLQLAATLGAAGVALNPLHALFDDCPDEPSPYSPSSRLFLNPLYIDVDAVPEFPGLQAAGIAEDVGKLRQAKLVDYRGVARAKMRALERAYDAFMRAGSKPRRRAFEAFRRDRGEVLSQFACFEWLRRHRSGPWRDWSSEWRKPDALPLARLRAGNADEIGLFEYVQWLAAEQLEHCCVQARRLSLPIGLYLDIAVGVRPDGFDAWSNQDSILPDVAIGAPPDALNTAGQNWGLAGINPNGLEQRAFEPFRRMLQASMRYAGAIRLDHVLGLKRLYLIPQGTPPDKGAYVRFPFEALLAVAAQESVRHKCIVIGEDLGTVPENFREQLADWGLWSYQVMLFERTPDGSFRAPEDYRADALVSFATHDLPTFAGWTGGHDLTVKRALGLDPGETDQDRLAAIAALRDALSVRGIEFSDYPSVTKYLAATPSRLLVVALEDVLGVTEQVNVPGTVNEHPNWRRRLPLVLRKLAQHANLGTIADIMSAAGRNTARRS